MDEKQSDAFAREYGADVYQALFESFYEHRAGKSPTDARFSITDVTQHDACNYSFDAIFDAPNGDEVSILARDGNWDGSIIEKWSKDDLLEREPHEPTVYSFKPTEWLSPAMFGVYLAWRKTPWFQEMEHSYNYDRFFAPGGKTEQHYRGMAAKRGLIIATKDACDAYIARGPMTDEDRQIIEELAISSAGES